MKKTSSQTTYEDILEELGPTGRYQFLLFLLMLSLVFTIGCHFKFMIYGGIFPKEIPCQMNGSDAMLAAQRSDWLLDTNGTGPCNRSTEDECSNNSSVTSTVHLSNAMANSNESEVCYDYDNMLFYSIAAKWKLVGPRRPIVSTIISIQMAGIFLGPLIGGQLSDRFGRKPALLVETALLGVVGFAAGLSPNWETFAAMRFFIGMFAGAALSSAFVYATENMLRSYRVLYNTMPWPLNFFYFSLLGWLTRDWSIMSYAVNATLPIALIIEVMIFESPKWLLARNRHDEAQQILLKIAKINRADTKRVLQVIEKAEECNPMLDAEKEPQRTYSYYHLFYSRQASIYFVVLMICFVTVAGNYYCILYNIGNIAANPFVLTVVLGCAETVFNICANFIDFKVPICGRREMLIFGVVSAAICDAILGILHLTGVVDRVPYAPSIPSIAGLSLTVFFWIGAVMMSVEVFPTELRNMGNSACNTAARIGGIVGPQILTLTYLWAPAPYFIFVVILILTSILAFFTLPETKNRPLPDLPKKVKKEEA